MTRPRLNSLELARYLLRQTVVPGSTVLDATAGQGRDTLFLAQLIGPLGKVWAFDIQAEALAATEELLRANKVEDRVTLIHASHEKIEDYIAEPLQGAMFNLGYLPGGDKTIITKPSSTLKALQQVVLRLAPGGWITLVLYTGHPGGMDEAGNVEEFVKGLPQAEYDVLKLAYPNRGENTPYLVAIQKR